ncbi:hypothetical protein Lalb_Chr09g0331411 [Lupinus albus]|uniref:Uncharacterized protein n=1 Tax=Lupinus albus TaxID=3870 RepID=A0A6A4Q230_LUPAL|nr:hypothetical protein Lalb_Chr09g0331411 [Lupinus albus]
MEARNFGSHYPFEVALSDLLFVEPSAGSEIKGYAFECFCTSQL